MELPPYFARLAKKYRRITPKEWELVNQFAEIIPIQKGDHFLQHGEIAHFAAFVISGQFKFNLYDDDGNEKILKFSFIDDFLANCDSYHNDIPSKLNIEAIEDSVVLRLNISQMQPLFDLHINILRINLDLYQDILENHAEHQYILSLKTPLQKYRYLLRSKPMIIQKISLTNISKYLYTSREALSRARTFCLKFGS
jgi:CRP-like cAMP-binding protein